MIIGIGITIAILIIFLGGLVTWFLFDCASTKAGTISIIISVFLLIVVIVGTIILLNNTESGKRELKDMKSDWTGGLTRTVTVYDVNGKQIQKYEGKFDIECGNNKIKFDDDKGERHIIYYTTGTVIIDEK